MCVRVRAFCARALPSVAGADAHLLDAVFREVQALQHLQRADARREDRDRIVRRRERAHMLEFRPVERQVDELIVASVDGDEFGEVGERGERGELIPR